MSAYLYAVRGKRVKTVLLACANSDQGIIVRYLGSTSRAGPGHTVYACVHDRPALT